MSKKDFSQVLANNNPFNKRDYPAMNFISKESIEAVDGKQPKQDSPTEAPEEPRNVDYKRDKVVYIEKKTERLQLLLQPSIKEALQKEAKKKHTSVNELINGILREHFNKQEI